MRRATVIPDPALDSVKGQFDQWRNDRSNPRESIPQNLWQAAAELCNTCSISQVARSLRLSYTDLKKRVSPIKNGPVPNFIPLDIGSLSCQWHIECHRTDGARLGLSGGGKLPDIENMLARFLS